MSLYLALSCISDTGCVRKHNEDNIVFFGHVLPAEHQSLPVLEHRVSVDDSFCVGVFDGMGGEAAGEMASYAAATHLAKIAKTTEVWNRSVLESLYQSMNQAVVEAQRAEKAQSMGSTAVLLCVSGGQFIVSNIGDSSAFVFDGSSLTMVSKEHTDRELLNELGIARTPSLTQYLGMDLTQVIAVPHIASFDIRQGMTVVLCSDGLSGTVTSADIIEVLQRVDDTALRAQSLKNLALEKGSKDNITVIVCDVRWSEGE